MKDFPFDNLFVTTHKLSNTILGHESLTVNGEVNPVINITSGETQLWRLANIGSENEFSVTSPWQYIPCYSRRWKPSLEGME